MTQTQTITIPDTAPLAAGHQSLMQLAHELAVTDKGTHEQGLTLLKDLAGAEKRVVELFKEPKNSAHRLHKFLTGLEGAALRPIQDARAEVSKKVTEFEAEEKRRADEEAKKKAEAARKAEEDRKLREAEEAAKSGDKQLADEILEEPIETPVIPAAPELAKVDGVVTTSRWKAEVVDPLALVKFIAANPQWIHLVEPVMPQLNSLARAQRQNLKLPGVRAVEERSKAVRA